MTGHEAGKLLLMLLSVIFLLTAVAMEFRAEYQSALYFLVFSWYTRWQMTT